MSKYLITTLLLLGFLYSEVIAEKVDESALFADSTVLTDSSAYTNNANMNTDSTKTVTISGEIQCVSLSSAPKGFFNSPKSSDLQMQASAVGNFFLDARLYGGAKAFSNFEIDCSASKSSVQTYIRELFFDVNIKKLLYFRAGKQILQWGRCNLWNPTDLINVEKKLLIPKIGYREGTYGLKMHIPYKSILNFYGFIDTKNAVNADSIALAAKTEAVIGGTEMALSVWKKKHLNPVYGYDISTRLFGFDIAGEVSASYGDNNYRIEIINPDQYNISADQKPVLSERKTTDTWIPRACVDIGHTFDAGDVIDRISVNAEFYYNHDGYDHNLFQDTNRYNYETPIMAMSQSGQALLDPITGKPMMITTGTKSEFLFGNGLYELDNLSKYYLALFTNIAKFPTNEMSLSFNFINNLIDLSSTLAGTIQYKNLHDFTLGLTIIGFIGKDRTEYTLNKQLLSVQLNAGIVF